MTASDRFERLFADVLTDVAQPTYPDYIEDALERATRASQRPAWTFPERWFPMGTTARSVPFAPGLPWRNLVVIAVLALLAAAVLVIAIGTQARPAPPFGPAGNGTLAYQVDGEIYARDLLGGEQELLIGGPETDVYPFFSRDGTQLAFIRIDPATLGQPNEQAFVMVANADGSDQRALAGPIVIESVSWSPDSRELALVTRTSAVQQLSIVPIDGSAPRVIDVGLPLSEGAVAWRPPNGRELIFRSPAGGTNRFYAIGADGTGLRPITPDGVRLPAGGGLSFTPDGRSVVHMNMTWPYSLRVIDLETGLDRPFGERLPVLSEGDTHAGGQLVSADGTKLVFGRYWDERDGTINHQIWVASLSGDGSDAVPIGPVVRSESGRDPYVVMAAPDGSLIVVHRAESTETWATDFSGGGLRSLDLGNFADIDWQRVAP